jgi:HAD superfamily hydrolase (TIGR01490 family)
MRGYALFDLDHTLLPFDTQTLFCNFILRREPWRRTYLLWFLPCLPLAALRIVSLRFMKRLFCSYLHGMPEATLRAYAREFAETVVPRVVYPEILAEMEIHRAEGRVIILNSASPGLYVKEIARVLGFDHWFATRLAIADPMPWAPDIEGPNNKQEAKIPPMIPVLPEGFTGAPGETLPDSIGYSDSAADMPLLSICERGVMIHPGKKFAAIGAARGWTIRKPARPYAGKWSGLLAGALQAFGLYRLPSGPFSIAGAE